MRLASSLLPALAAVGLVSSVAVAAAKQQKAVPERGVEHLRVDFAVVSLQGDPITDLKPEEITVKVGGRTRVMRSLQIVAVPESTAGEGASLDPRLPPPFGTNTTADAGRTLALVIDDDSFRPGREAPMRDAVDVLIRRLASDDKVALVTVPYGGIKVPFTTEHRRIRAAMANIVGHAPSDESGSDFACRTGRTLESLGGFINTMGIREEPATLILITAGLAAPRRDAPMALGPGKCELRADLFTQIGVAAGAARTQFYIVQPGDLMRSSGSIQRENLAGYGTLGSDNPIEGIEHLAGVTGAKLLNLTGSAETALGRILRETSTHYIAAIEPERNDRNGRPQPLEIRVRRPGVQVRSRPQITFAKPEPSLGRPVGLSPREMLSTAEVIRDLPLRAAGYVAVSGDGETMRVTTIAEPAEPGVKLGTLLAALFDADGKPVAHWSATSAELQRTPVIGAMPAPPGAYRLRVAAIDTEGRSGTADSDVTVETPRTGPLKLSSLVLGLSREGAFAPRLQFVSEPVAIAYVEMYGSAAGQRVTATLEVAGTLNGPPLVAVPLAIQAAGPNRYAAQGAVAIGALAPGDYIVRALISLEGHPMTRVVRTLRKAVPAK